MNIFDETYLRIKSRLIMEDAAEPAVVSLPNDIVKGLQSIKNELMKVKNKMKNAPEEAAKDEDLDRFLDGTFSALDGDDITEPLEKYNKFVYDSKLVRPGDRTQVLSFEGYYMAYYMFTDSPWKFLGIVEDFRLLYHHYGKNAFLKVIDYLINYLNLAGDPMKYFIEEFKALPREQKIYIYSMVLENEKENLTVFDTALFDDYSSYILCPKCLCFVPYAKNEKHYKKCEECYADLSNVDENSIFKTEELDKIFNSRYKANVHTMMHKLKNLLGEYDDAKNRWTGYPLSPDDILK